MIVLLAVEGVLWLCERFGWFGFDEHKGWPVLIALVSVVAAILSMLLWLAAALVFRVRFQFSLRSLLVLVVAVALPCSWLAAEMKAARSQKEAVDGIRKLGGWAELEYMDNSVFGGLIPEPKGPRLLRKLLGDHFFNNVVGVGLGSVGKVEHLDALIDLQTNEMYGGCRLTDAGLRYLEPLTQLRHLDLRNTPVVDSGLRHLERLTQLEMLDLQGTEVTDAGLQHLERLTQLECSCLSDTRVKGVGSQHLGHLPQLRRLDLAMTDVTDTELRHLGRLTGLEELRLSYTYVTDAGLQHLEPLTRLKRLDLRDTAVTSKGVDKLQRSLENCAIVRGGYLLRAR